MQDDKKWMKHAIKLAKRGLGKVNPNPMVGAVIVKDGVLIGEGWHEEYGGLHAERNAIIDCKNCYKSNWDVLLKDATIYVTLEPCCHYGKTPPCTEAIIQNSIGRVVIGAVDPNPLVGGKGIKILKENGITVENGLLEEECIKQNEIFFHYIKTNKPYVVMKYAMTLDGKISTYTGHSKWITGEVSRQHVHDTRKRLKAIMVGINTVIMDNPMLNCRLKDSPSDPIRIICDSNLRIPLNSNIVKTAKNISTIVVCICDDDNQDYNKDEKKKELERNCIKVLEIKANSKGQIDLNELMMKLGKMNIDSILLEGGSTLNFSALQSGIVSKVQVYIAPKIFGGEAAKTPVGGEGVPFAYEGFKLEKPIIKMLGEDFLLEYKIVKE
nr:bifunctional diaminohydroxyphosphoribosylaminopyrimidine deaminase/5-amino-6-(5-phosphoribosylamino)uracil reductase RibD [Anaerovorax odorimutans]